MSQGGSKIGISSNGGADLDKIQAVRPHEQATPTAASEHEHAWAWFNTRAGRGVWSCVQCNERVTGLDQQHPPEASGV